MGIELNYERARRVLERAIAAAQSDAELSEEWTKRATLIGEAFSKTFTPALGTGLLARATDSRVDTLALKVESGPNAYSARTLCHTVLVPASVRHGFSLRTTGREPLNNQPFFRYDRVDQMDRIHVRARESHSYLVECLRRANQLSSHEAEAALATFLRIGFAVAKIQQSVAYDGGGMSVRRCIDSAETLLTENAEGGRRAQAMVAAALDVVYGDVRTHRVNDPSRHFPGDVQAFSEGSPILSAEVRAKPMSGEEVRQFGKALADATIDRGLVVAVAQGASRVDLRSASNQVLRDHGVLVTVVGSVEELLLDAFGWSPRPLAEILRGFPGLVAKRLAELEVSSSALTRWAELCVNASQSRTS